MTGGATRLFRDNAANLPVLRLGSTHSIDRSVTAGTGGPGDRSRVGLRASQIRLRELRQNNPTGNSANRVKPALEKIFRLAFRENADV
jgi:hypothetical protein